MNQELSFIGDVEMRIAINSRIMHLARKLARGTFPEGYVNRRIDALIGAAEALGLGSQEYWRGRYEYELYDEQLKALTVIQI